MSNGTYEPQLGVVVPAEKVAQVEHSLPPAGSGPESAPATVRKSTSSSAALSSSATAPPPPVFDRIPGQMLSANTPVPLSPELIDVQNGWLTSDGKTLVAVYAGAAGTDPEKGRFVIVRQDLAAGRQTTNVVDVPGAGAVSITNAPTGAAIETTGQRGRIGFHGSHGSSGTLDLVTDSTNGQ
jgi:hypothetical protein